MKNFWYLVEMIIIVVAFVCWLEIRADQDDSPPPDEIVKDDDTNLSVEIERDNIAAIATSCFAQYPTPELACASLGLSGQGCDCWSTCMLLAQSDSSCDDITACALSDCPWLDISP